MAHLMRISVPTPPRRLTGSSRSQRSPVRGVERLWTRLTDLFRGDSSSKLATATVLAPRRLEPRRLLDAGAAGLVLETLDYSADYVQVGSDYAELAASAEASASANLETEAGSIEFLSSDSIVENDVATLEFVYDVPGAQSVKVEWGDGQIDEFDVSDDAQSLSTTHRYLDDPLNTLNTEYTVTVSVTGAGGMVSDTTTLTVLNDPPEITLLTLKKEGEDPLLEGNVAELTVNFSDDGTLDTHTIYVDWGDGESEFFDLSGERSFSTTHRYPDDPPSGNTTGSYTATVRVVDDDGGEDIGEVTIQMLNVAPVIDSLTLVKQGEGPMREGDVAELTVNFTDPGSGDTHTVFVDWGDGTSEFFNLTGDRSLTTTHRYLDDPPTDTPTGSYTATVRIVDDDTGEDTGEVTIQMLNVAPEITSLTLVNPEGGPLREGEFAELTIDFADPGTLDTHTVYVDWGDGVTEFFNLTGERSFFTTHRYLDDPPTGNPTGSYTATVRIVDDDTGEDTGEVTIQMVNVDPTITSLILVNPSGGALVEGSVLELSINFDDPGVLDTHVVVVNWDDGTIDTFALDGDRQVVTSHIYADNGNYRVTITITDDDTGEGTGEETFAVLNVAPTILPLETEPTLVINESETITLPDLHFTDPGFNNPLNVSNPDNGGEVEETFTYTIDWGDGTVETFAATWTSGGENVLTTGVAAGRSHTYLDNPSGGNVYTVIVTVQDDDEGATPRPIAVTVYNVAPRLDPITATEVSPQGITILTLRFTDPGADSYRVLVDWGDNLTEEVLLERFEIERNTAPTAASGAHVFQIAHRYDGPPDPLHPAADIIISVKIWDDDLAAAGVVPLDPQAVVERGESNVEVVVIGNPGAGVNAVRIDTTPQVPLLTVNDRPVSSVTVAQAATNYLATTQSVIGGAGGESAITGERYLELRVVSPDDKDSEEGIPLAQQWLNNLPGLFRKLPDNHYRIYLVQAETAVPRLVLDVYVRNGKLIDPGDDSDGARDRPPTDETAQGAGGEVETAPNDEERAKGPATGASEELPPSAALPAPNDGATAELAPWRASGLTAASTSAAWRHGRVLAGVAVGLAAAKESWRWQVDDALAKARPKHWQRLRASRYWRRRRPR